MRAAVAVLVSLTALGCSERDFEWGEPEFPKPTENHLEEEAEERNHIGRERWFEEMHRTDRGVDWRAIERANGAVAQARRNALALAGPLPAQAAYWTEVGSKNQAGRMHCAVISPDGASIYAGSSLGGLWKSNYAGTSWTPLGDNLYGGVTDAVVLPGEHPGDPDCLVISGTSGVRVSRDQGMTWETPIGLSNVTAVRRVALFDDAVHTIVVYAQTNLAGNVPALYASTDYGRNFVKRYQAPVAGNSAAWIPRTGPGAVSSVYMVLNGRVYTSSDGGFNFTPRIVIDASAIKATITGSEVGAPTLYVALYNGADWRLYRSDDAGVSSTGSLQTLTDYYEELVASTISAGTVIYGGVEAFRSTNSGANFTKINTWSSYYGDPLHKLHADTMGLYAQRDAQSTNGESLFFCMDGGLWRSYASGLSPLNLSMSGLGVSQYYSTHTSVANTTRIHAGSQDQGYQVGILQPPAPSGPSTNFTQTISGDYGHLTSGDGTHALVYSNYPGFTLVSEGETANNIVAQISFPSGSAHLWLPPVVADPLDNASYFLCTDKLLRFTRTGTSTWNGVQHSTQDFAAGSANYLTALAFAPSDAQHAYACDDFGRLYYSSNHGVAWTQASSNAPGEHYFYGNTFSVHPTNPLECVVGGSGYSSAGVRRTIDGGVNWGALTASLPQTFVYDLAYARDGTGDIYAATEAGAFRYDRASGQWVDVMLAQAPITTYWSVEFVGTDLVRFGTYGRGIWDYHLPQIPAPSVYCSPKISSALCIPAIGFAGLPSMSSTQPFLVNASQILSQKTGLLFYGYSAANAPFQGGTLCVFPPTKRTPVQGSGGSSTCGGAYAFDFNARIQSGVDPQLVAGALVFAQYWYRDPQDLYTTGLTDAVQFTIGQ